MDAAFCEGSARGSALKVLDRANDEQGAAGAEWQSKNKKTIGPKADRVFLWYTQGKRKGIELSPRKTASRPKKYPPVSPAAAVSSAHKSPQVVPDGTPPSGKCEPDSADPPLYIQYIQGTVEIALEKI